MTIDTLSACTVFKFGQNLRTVPWMSFEIIFDEFIPIVCAFHCRVARNKQKPFHLTTKQDWPKLF